MVMKKSLRELFLKEQGHRTLLILTTIFILLGAGVLFLCISCALGEDIWFDEVFSVRFMQKGYLDIAALTAQDVHPPFYYWYLKTFNDLFKGLGSPASSVVLAKMASVLPYLSIWVYAFTLIRKRMGMPVAAAFLFFVSAMPQLSNYIVEIRMYSLALFLTTAVFCHSYEIVCENKKRHWILFCFYGILTAYTQYYACVGIVAVYIALFVYFLWTGQNKALIRLMVAALVSVLLYLPWLPAFLGQLRTVSSSYWIQPLTFRSIFGCMKYVFLPVSYDTGNNYVLAVCMIVLFASFYLYALCKEKSKNVRYLLLCGVFIPVFTAGVGFICSALNRPIFVYRYLLPGLGAMWLVAAYALVKYRRERILLLVWIPFLLAGYSNMKGFYAEENKKVVQMESTQAFLEAFPKDAVILCNFNHVQALTGYYLANENYLYGGEPEKLIATLQPNCLGMPDTEDLQHLVETEDVYFFGSFEAREELLKEWEEKKITYTQEGTYLLERYYFNVYHLKIENSSGK